MSIRTSSVWSWLWFGIVLGAVTLLGVVCLQIFNTVRAQEIPKLLQRTLNIHTSEPGAVTDYTMSWRLPSNATVGSVRLELCIDPYLNDPCSYTPDGDFSGAVLDPGDQSGAVTGFSILSQTANEIILTRTPNVVGTGLSTYNFHNIQNPTGIHASFYVRVYIYTSADASGVPIFHAGIGSATASPIMITTTVPPILYFCAAITIDEWCDSISGNFINYGELDPVNGHSATSQFGVATNAPGGYIVTVTGNTMTSGNKVIESSGLLEPFTPGVPQFGLNLRANTLPAIGQDVLGAGIGVVAPDYDVPDLFKFNSGDVVASAPTGSMFNTYTVTYIVNVPPDLPAGIYNTTIAYTCTAAF